MLIEELDILERVEAYKLKGFPEFLEERPSSEDFGESLDIYRKKLMKAGLLDEQNETSIRGLHLHHQSKLLNNEKTIITFICNVPIIGSCCSIHLQDESGKNEWRRDFFQNFRS